MAPSTRMPPRVSIVLVTFNAWEWTERALAALARSTPEDHEIIVVDNASSDGTLEGLRARDPAVRLVTNDANVGFGPACNQGARIADGALVCLLNTDALVEPGWLSPLCAAVEGRSDVGAAVPLVLNLDGSVQCAGALLARDGTVIEYGNGLDADDPAVAYRRAVDFGPAACMLLDRTAFLARGGFDETFAPAYYEDADLCLALASRGLRTLYVPASRVRHARYGSGSSAGASALSEHHRRLFAERWSDVLAARPSTLHPPVPARVLCARDAVADGRVLVLGGTAGDGHDRALRELLAARPWGRITLAGAGHEAWLGSGVEVVDEGHVEAITARRFHYDAVVSGEPSPAVAAALDRHQPQAVRLPWPAPGAAATALASAGLVSP